MFEIKLILQEVNHLLKESESNKLEQERKEISNKNGSELSDRTVTTTRSNGDRQTQSNVESNENSFYDGTGYV